MRSLHRQAPTSLTSPATARDRGLPSWPPASLLAVTPRASTASNSSASLSPAAAPYGLTATLALSHTACVRRSLQPLLASPARFTAAVDSHQAGSMDMSVSQAPHRPVTPSTDTIQTGWVGQHPALSGPSHPEMGLDVAPGRCSPPCHSHYHSSPAHDNGIKLAHGYTVHGDIRAASDQHSKPLAVASMPFTAGSPTKQAGSSGQSLQPSPPQHAEGSLVAAMQALGLKDQCSSGVSPSASSGSSSSGGSPVPRGAGWEQGHAGGLPACQAPPPLTPCFRIQPPGDMSAEEDEDDAPLTFCRTVVRSQARGNSRPTVIPTSNKRGLTFASDSDVTSLASASPSCPEQPCTSEGEGTRAAALPAKEARSSPSGSARADSSGSFFTPQGSPVASSELERVQGSSAGPGSNSMLSSTAAGGVSSSGSEGALTFTRTVRRGRKSRVLQEDASDKEGSSGAAGRRLSAVVRGQDGVFASGRDAELQSVDVGAMAVPGQHRVVSASGAVAAPPFRGSPDVIVISSDEEQERAGIVGRYGGVNACYPAAAATPPASAVHGADWGSGSSDSGGNMSAGESLSLGTSGTERGAATLLSPAAPPVPPKAVPPPAAVRGALELAALLSPTAAPPAHPAPAAVRPSEVRGALELATLLNRQCSLSDARPAETEAESSLGGQAFRGFATSAFAGGAADAAGARHGELPPSEAGLGGGVGVSSRDWNCRIRESGGGKALVLVPGRKRRSPKALTPNPTRVPAPKPPVAVVDLALSSSEDEDDTAGADAAASSDDELHERWAVPIPQVTGRAKGKGSGPAVGPKLPDAITAGAMAVQQLHLVPPRRRGGRPAAPANPQLAFARKRVELAQTQYREWNVLIFGGRLPPDLPVVWNPRLLSTAGQVLDNGTRNSEKKDKSERIPTQLELSVKVIDSVERLRITLAHEMCHVAAWSLDREYYPHHGPAFWRWAGVVERALPDITVTRLHDFALFAPYRWACKNASCGKTYSRYRQTIDVAKHQCGVCHGNLTFLGKFDRKGRLVDGGAGGAASAATAGAGGDGGGIGQGPAGGGGAHEYRNFVKQNFAEVKSSQPPGTPHGTIMKVLSARWSSIKTIKKQQQQQQQQQQQGGPEQQAHTQRQGKRQQQGLCGQAAQQQGEIEQQGQEGARQLHFNSDEDDGGSPGQRQGRHVGDED